ncbi:MAG: hypothetical protein IJ682_07180 [Lachnospiraceae bacterium]|nr:hypothetical protein [Lachnospiraceae bacterium]
MGKTRDIHDYDDIIDLPRPVSKKHQQMDIANRAAQFAPFAALTGHADVIREVVRENEAEMEKGQKKRETEY